VYPSKANGYLGGNARRILQLQRQTQQLQQIQQLQQYQSRQQQQQRQQQQGQGQPENDVTSGSGAGSPDEHIDDGASSVDSADENRQQHLDDRQPQVYVRKRGHRRPGQLSGTSASAAQSAPGNVEEEREMRQQR
jgi:type II secretory pathway pseudopilin PulG